MVYLRDPIELIAELFVNPQIMFKYRSNIHFRYYNKSNNPIISPVHADLMTSEWCRKTEDIIIQKSVDGYILPLIFNSDGAQLGANINNKTTPLMCTTGNFSDDLIDQDISKCVIGYLPDLKDYKANIWNHLKRIYRSESAVIEQIQLFDRLVERECWNEIIKCVNKHWQSGVKLMVLGEGIKLFFPCVAFFDITLHTVLMQLEFWKVIKYFARIRRRHIKNYDMFFVGAIRYFSDPKSLGDGTLYATTSFASRSSSRYDFVLVRTTSGGDKVDDDDYSLSDGHRRSNKPSDMKQYKTILAKLILFICIGNYY